MPQDRRPVRLAAAVFFVAAALALTLAPCGNERPPPRANAPDAPPAPAADRREPRARRETPPPVESTPAESAPPAAEPESKAAGVERVLRVRVLDSSGAPAAGASVVFYNQRAALDLAGWTKYELARSTADGDGRAEVRTRDRDIHPSMVHASARGEAAVRGNLSSYGDEPVDVELRLGPVVSVRGVVRRTDGRPVADAEVSGRFEVPHWTFLARAKTTAEGRFVLDGLPRAQFQRTATLRVDREPGHWSGETKASLADAESGEVVLTVEPTRQLRGRCVDALRAPIAMPWADYRDGGWRFGEDGRFDLQILTGVERVRLHNGHAPLVEKVIDVPAGESDVHLGDVVLAPAPPK